MALDLQAGWRYQGNEKGRGKWLLLWRIEKQVYTDFTWFGAGYLSDLQMNKQRFLYKVLLGFLIGLLVQACVSTQSNENAVSPDVTDSAAEVAEAETLPREKMKKSKAEAPQVLTESPSDQAVATQESPRKRGANHFVVTVDEKTRTHPGYAKGHTKGFFLDGKAGTPVVLKRGETYEFDISSEPLYNVYFSSSATGWGGSPVVSGIKGQFTHDGTITFVPDSTTPNVVYYSSQNHKNMGWKIHVVDHDASPSEIKQILADAKAELGRIAGSSRKTVTQKPGAKIKQKLLLAGMMISSGGVKRVLASSNDEAKEMISDAKVSLEAGQKALDGGDTERAKIHADSALKLTSKAQRLVPTAEELKEQLITYKEKMASVKQFEISYKEQYDDTVKKRGKKATVEYNETKVIKLLGEAKVLAEKKQFFRANENLQQAEYLITSAIQKMMDKQKIVYELNIDTPEGEYQYELRRYKSYYELIPVAVRELKPSEGIRMLIDMYVKKGEDQKAAAVAKAKAGDLPVAIAMILSATKNIRLALKTAGVPQ